jgi:hypothetical protein
MSTEHAAVSCSDSPGYLIRAILLIPNGRAYAGKGDRRTQVIKDVTLCFFKCNTEDIYLISL